MAKSAKKEYLIYKGKPLVRKGNKILYGDLSERYIIIFTINKTATVNDMEVATDVTIDLCTNSGREKERNIKKATRDGLFAALDLAEFWLQDALENG
ncbi:MAG: hypothetical protein Q4C12_01030 [Clostridia bacterium]|nr:hypothetical protein [Clostridia bacterium]